MSLFLQEYYNRIIDRLRLDHDDLELLLDQLKKNPDSQQSARVEDLTVRKDKVKLSMEAFQNAYKQSTLDNFIHSTECHFLMNQLFPESILNLFGGYKQFLSLPIFSADTFNNENTNEYNTFPPEKMPSYENMAIGMDVSRPVIALRIIFKEAQQPEREMIICYHGRYTSEITNWVRGQLPKGGAKLWDLPEWNSDGKHKTGEFHYLQSMLAGNPVNLYGDLVNLAPSKHLVLEQEIERLQMEQRRLSLLISEKDKRVEFENMQLSEHSKHQRCHDKLGLILRLFKIPGAEAVIADQQAEFNKLVVS